MQTIKIWRHSIGQRTLHKILHTLETTDNVQCFTIALCSFFLLLPQHAPAFSILDVRSESSEYRVQFESETNQYYRLYYTADLVHPAWTPQQMCLGTQDTQVISIPAMSPEPATGFLRLSALPMDANEDADRDGYGDVMELQEGIDPLNMTNAPRLIHVHSFDGATKTNTFFYAPGHATSLGYVQYYNTGCLVGDGLGQDGSDGLNFIVPHGTSLFMQVYLSRNSWNSPHPSPGSYYRISFDARAEKKNQYFHFYWYDNGYYSSRTSTNGTLVHEHLYFQEPVLLSTSWTTYSRTVYFHSDPKFSYWNVTNDSAFRMRFEPVGDCNIQIDNLRLEKMYPAISNAPALVNRGFERGFYGWTDTTFWNQRAVPPETETNRSHWTITTETAHSGRACAKLIRRGDEGTRFMPSLMTGLGRLEPGLNYAISGWVKTTGTIGTVTITVQDNCWGGYLTKTQLDSSTAWRRFATVLYHYGDMQTLGIPYRVNGGPETELPVIVSISPRINDQPAALFLDDLQIDVVSDEVASAMTNAPGQNAALVPGFPASRFPVEGDLQPARISTCYSDISSAHPVSPWTHRIAPDESLLVPVQLTINTNLLTPPADLVLSLTLLDYQSEPLFATNIPLNGILQSYTNTLNIPPSVLVGQTEWPEGMYMYRLSVTPASSPASISEPAWDRFYVCTYTNLQPIPEDGGFLAVDLDSMTQIRRESSSEPTYRLRENPDFDFDVYLPHFTQLGARYARVWLFGAYPEELSALTDTVAHIRSAGMEPLLCINGFVSAQSNECYSLTSPSIYATKWNESSWVLYLQQLAGLLSVSNNLYVRHWEILNEPSPFRTNSDAYTNVLGVSCRTLKAIDSNAVIHGFSVIPSPYNIDLIESCAQKGALRDMDILDPHLYNHPSYDFTAFSELKRIVRTHLDNNTNAFSSGEEYLPVESMPIWMSEFTAFQRLASPENRITAEDRKQAALLLQKLITAKAFHAEKFFLFDAGYAFTTGFSSISFHRGAGAMQFNLMYAVTKAFATWLEPSDLLRAYDMDHVRAFVFRRDDGREVMAIWSVAPGETLELCNLPADLSIIRMDGSAYRQPVSDVLCINNEPLFLTPKTGLTFPPQFPQ